MDKETLQKKIENGDTVWVIKLGYREVLELKLSSEYKTNDYGELVHLLRDFDGPNSCIRTYKEIYHVFDTKEDAEFELEFGNIMLTEKLELPTWERFKTQPYFTFTGKNIYHGYMEEDYCNEKTERVISVCGKIFDFTYDGYLEACRLCKELFLGGAK